MSVVDINVAADPLVHVLDVVLTVDLMSIEIPEFTFKIEGSDYTLSGGATVNVVADPSYSTQVWGYLALDLNDSNNVVLVVDEILDDGVDLPFIFDGSTDYQLLERLFEVTVPSGTTDLSGLALHRWRLISA